MVSLIENRFADFLNPDFIYQDQEIRSHYYNSKYKVCFFHDFDKYYSFYSQLLAVQDKYQRRIDRFYKAIKEPTLFIRYIRCDCDDCNKELALIEDTYEQIMTLIKSFNSENEIIFIANSEFKSSKIKVFNVEKDENDSVARRPFMKNELLKQYFCNVNFRGKEDNINRFKKKEKQKSALTKRIRHRLLLKLKSMLFKEYVFERQIRF